MRETQTTVISQGLTDRLLWVVCKYTRLAKPPGNNLFPSYPIPLPVLGPADLQSTIGTPLEWHSLVLKPRRHAYIRQEQVYYYRRCCFLLAGWRIWWETN